MIFRGVLRRENEDAAAFDAIAAFEDDAHGFGIDAMLFGEDAGGERLLGVVVADGHGGLEDDGAGVEIFVHEVHSAAGDFHAVIERLALGFESRERGEKRRMDIEDASAKGLDEMRREKAHVAGEADEINTGGLERGDDEVIVGFAFEALRGDDFGGDAARAGALDAGGAFAMADDDGDFGVGNAAEADTLRERLKIRAAAGEKHADALFHGSAKLAQIARGAKRITSGEGTLSRSGSYCESREKNGGGAEIRIGDWANSRARSARGQ